jgi:hypothetical protein
MERKLLTIGGMVAVIVALFLLWQLSQNGRYVPVPQLQTTYQILLLDTRSGELIAQRPQEIPSGARLVRTPLQ